jgi:hypothetical protein
LKAVITHFWNSHAGSPAAQLKISTLVVLTHQKILASTPEIIRVLQIKSRYSFSTYCLGLRFSHKK